MSSPSSPIDLRSDTVTQPTAGMRRAMAEAVVGDDVYGEDPTVRRLEEVAAQVLGQEASLFVPSGTMANQIALQLHCRPGQRVFCQPGTHLHRFESGAGSAYAGVQFDVCFTTAFELERALEFTGPADSPPRLLVLENTHGDGGGVAIPVKEVIEMVGLASSHGLRCHLDGARVWNAAAALGCPEAEITTPFDTVSACFSKGLGAPVGSVLAGSADAIRDSRFLRRRMGGGMRQAGILAAGALYGLQHHRSRLPSDHENARALAERLSGIDHVRCEPSGVHTNIVFFEPANVPASVFCERARTAGVLLHPVGPSTVRAVTHLDVGEEEVAQAASRLAKISSPRA